MLIYFVLEFMLLSINPAICKTLFKLFEMIVMLYILQTCIFAKTVSCQELKSFRNREYYIEYDAPMESYADAKYVCVSKDLRLVAITGKKLFDYLIMEIRQNLTAGKIFQSHIRIITFPIT